VREEGEAAVRCISPDCPAQRLRHLIHFTSRDAMDIEGCGPAVLEQLVQRGLVCHAYDLYTLQAEQIADIERMGEKSAENLLHAVDASRDRDLYRVIYACGIRHIGEKAAKLLAGHFGTMQAVMAASVEEMMAIDGFGAVMAQSVADFFANAHSVELVERLADVGVNMTCRTERADTRFAGITFVLTGTLPTLKRSEAAALIEKYGGKTAGSVSARTGIVLAGEEAGSKLDKARQLGIRIIDEATFLDMLK
jgi:DNA ligase (NAD+)